MNRKMNLVWATLLTLGFSVAGAQDSDDPVLPDAAAEEARSAVAEATIRLMDDVDADNGEAVTNEVELPTAEGKGLVTAEMAIKDGKNFGRDIAAGAPDTALEMAEGRSRGEDLPDDLPGRPDDLPVDPPVDPPTP